MANKRDTVKKAKGKFKEEIGGDRLKALLLKDDTFKKYRMIVKAIKEKLDIDDIDSEIMRLHEGRVSRTLYGTTPSAEKLMNAALQDSSNRSRMTALRVRITKQVSILDIALKAARIHLAREYADNMPDLKTKGERLMYFDSYLSKGVELHEGLTSLMGRIDMLIKDVDQNGFSLKHAVDLLSLVYSRNNDKKSA